MATTEWYPKLVLASKSPRRQELMALVNPRFVVDTADVKEAGITADNPSKLAETLAAEKAQAVFVRRSHDVVIGCDTVVELDGAALGKPANEQQAADVLHNLSGRWHQVHTGLCICMPEQKPYRYVETTKVLFAPIPGEAIAAYVQTSEPYDKAGGYGIQGWAARYIPRIEGCYYNVMGLPVASLYKILAEHGI